MPTDNSPPTETEQDRTASRRPVTRRTTLRTTAAALAGGLTAVSGCLDDPANEQGYTYETADGNYDGYPPLADDPPAERTIDTSQFPTKSMSGVAVPLAPLDVVYYWYQRGEARFADARGRQQYTNAHVYGAVLSPAPDGTAGIEQDAVKTWPKDDRIVCYCGCPHHLSSQRAATLIQNGYSNVYVIDEGFWDWQEAEYPMAGDDVETTPTLWEVNGSVPTAATTPSGEAASAPVVTLRHPATGQKEQTSVNPDGSYTLHVRFYEVSGDSEVVLETPIETRRGPLSEFAAERVDSSDSA